MKFFLIIIFFYAFSDCCYDQQSKNKFSLNFRTGASIPVSRFGDKTFSNSSGKSDGLAKTGFGLDMGIAYGTSTSDQ